MPGLRVHLGAGVTTQVARIEALAGQIRVLLALEDQAVVVSSLALICGEVLGSIHIEPPYTRSAALHLFFQQISDIAAKIEDQRMGR